MKLFLSKLFLYMFVGFVIIKLPATQPLIGDLCQFIASIVGHFLMLFDAAVHIKGATLYRVHLGDAIEVDKSCTALSHLVTLAAAILAFPEKLAIRIKAVLLAILFIQSINALRIISLLYARAELDVVIFDFIHEEFWMFFIPILVAVFYISWTAPRITSLEERVP